MLQLPMDPNVVAETSAETPLVKASGAGHVEAVRLLLEAGAAKNVADIDGNTAPW